MKLFLFICLFAFTTCGNKIYVVRHAEKEPVAANASIALKRNPSLSAKGQQRATALSEKLKGEKIEYIFSTDFKRTINTAQPTAEKAKVDLITVYSSRPDSLKYLIDLVKDIKKGNILIVGHSNTIDDIANALAEKKVVPGDLPETVYNTLYIIKRKGKRYLFKEKVYGAANE